MDGKTEASSRLCAGGITEELPSCVKCTCGALSPLLGAAQGKQPGSPDSDSQGSTGLPLGACPPGSHCAGVMGVRPRAFLISRLAL